MGNVFGSSCTYRYLYDCTDKQPGRPEGCVWDSQYDNRNEYGLKCRKKTSSFADKGLECKFSDQNETCGLVKACFYCKMGLGIMLLIIGFFLYYTAMKYKQATSAVVTNTPTCTEEDTMHCDEDNNCHPDKTWDCKLDIAYTTADGQKRTATGVDGGNSTSKYVKGQDITVWYNTTKPDDVTIVDPRLVAYIMLAAGIGFLIFTSCFWGWCMGALNKVSPECCGNKNAGVLAMEAFNQGPVFRLT